MAKPSSKTSGAKSADVQGMIELLDTIGLGMTEDEAEAQGYFDPYAIETESTIDALKGRLKSAYNKGLLDRVKVGQRYWYRVKK